MLTIDENDIKNLYDYACIEYVEKQSKLREQQVELLNNSSNMHQLINTFPNNDVAKRKRDYFLYLYSLRITTKQLQYLRQPDIDDVRYRKDIGYNFENGVVGSVPEDMSVFFHGTPLYFAHDIIRSGNISSSLARYGYATSTDDYEEVSVSTKGTVSASLYEYMNIYDYYLPAWCLFAITPKDEDAILYSWAVKLKSTNTNFRENPDCLLAIITTPENIELVKSWCQEYGLDSNKVMDFHNFLTFVSNRENPQLKRYL